MMLYLDLLTLCALPFTLIAFAVMGCTPDAPWAAASFGFNAVGAAYAAKRITTGYPRA